MLCDEPWILAVVDAPTGPVRERQQQIEPPRAVLAELAIAEVRRCRRWFRRRLWRRLWSGLGRWRAARQHEEQRRNGEGGEAHAEAARVPLLEQRANRSPREEHEHHAGASLALGCCSKRRNVGRNASLAEPRR